MHHKKQQYSSDATGLCKWLAQKVYITTFQGKQKQWIVHIKEIDRKFKKIHQQLQFRNIHAYIEWSE